MTQRQQNILKLAMIRYGVLTQYRQLTEECGELLAAFNHLLRGKDSKEAVITELADVVFMVEQFAHELGYEKYLEERNRKIERLADRISFDKYLEHINSNKNHDTERI